VDGSHFYLTGRHQLAEPVADGFHTYAVDWDEDSLTWSVDDHVFNTITRAEVEQQGPWVFDHPFYLLLNLAIGGNLGGEVPDTTTFPQSYVIDYVRVYQ
jgi:beta-glucanase (GH16 family)